MMLVPPSPCLSDLRSPLSVGLYSPYPDLDAPVVTWSPSQLSRWLRETLADKDVVPAEVQHTQTMLQTLGGSAMLTLTQQDLEGRLRSPRLAEIIFHALVARVEAQNQREDDSGYSGSPLAPPARSPASSWGSSLGSPRSSFSCDSPLSEFNNLSFDDVVLPVYHEMEPVPRPPVRSPVERNQEVPFWVNTSPMSPVVHSEGLLGGATFSQGGEPQHYDSNSGREAMPEGTSSGHKDSLHGDAPATAKAAPRRRAGGRPKSLVKKAPLRRRSSSEGQPRTGRLWQFLVRLLNDPQYNPSLIRWADGEDGVFHFVQGHKVAELWGKAKNNEAMNYEKMSRTMRTYTNKAFASHHRRLYYKFGEKATWRTSVEPCILPVGA